MRRITGTCASSAAIAFLLAVMLIATSSAQADQRRLLQPGATIRTGKVNGVGRIEYIRRTGEYRFIWKGFDGRLVEATYIPEWRAKVTLTASAEALPDGTWRYTYTLHNLPSSPQSVTAVYITSDVAPLRVLVERGWRFVGWKETYKGTALCLEVDPAAQPYSPLAPGQQLQWHVISGHPPAVGTCFVTTDAPIMRVPEEMPSALADQLPPGLDAGLRGETLSPRQSLSAETFLMHWRTAVKAGWVRDRRLASLLTTQVEQAVKALQRGDNGQAQRVLAAIQQLASEHRAQLEPEAEVLLLQSLPVVARRAGQ